MRSPSPSFSAGDDWSPDYGAPPHVPWEVARQPRHRGLTQSYSDDRSPPVAVRPLRSFWGCCSRCLPWLGGTGEPLGQHT
jgi:hypothetical protein